MSRSSLRRLITLKEEQTAIETLNGTDYGGRPVKVNEIRLQKKRSGGSRREAHAGFIWSSGGLRRFLLAVSSTNTLNFKWQTIQ